MDQPNAQLEQTLQQTHLSLKRELSKYASQDNELRKEFEAIEPPHWPASLAYLTPLTEVLKMASLLQRFYVRQFNQEKPSEADSPGRLEDGAAAYSTINLRSRENRTAKNNEQWTAASVQSPLPQVRTRNGVTITMEELQISSAGIRIPFQLRTDHPIWKAKQSEAPFPSLTPILTGVHASDGAGTQYSLEPTQEFTTTNYPDYILKSALTFRPVVSPETNNLHVVIPNVLFAPQNAFVATATQAILIEGPWEFEFLIRRA